MAVGAMYKTPARKMASMVFAKHTMVSSSIAHFLLGGTPKT